MNWRSRQQPERDAAMTPVPSINKRVRHLAAAGMLGCAAWAAIPNVADAAPVVQAPYSLTVFARSINGYSQPDSIVLWNDSVLVGYGNHVAKDGTDGKFSTIVQYSVSGTVQRTFQVPGHNDGLRVVGEASLWSLQNEDANPNLVVIDLESGTAQTFAFTPTVHGGGYDDMVVVDGQVLMTASNPNLDANGQNNFPALVRATLSGNLVDVEPILLGNASATDLSTGATVPLNLTDPDSLTADPRGNVVLDSQADSELVFIRHPLEADRKVARIGITTGAGPTTIDDTAFAPDGRSFMLVSDLAGDAVYRIDSLPFGFEPGTAYSASDTAGLVGTLNLDNGVLTPVVTGLGSARGILFVPSARKKEGEGR
jgi:hypothetical protein